VLDFDSENPQMTIGTFADVSNSEFLRVDSFDRWSV